MRRIRIAAIVLLLLSLFATVDLGLNFLFNLVPEALDGLTCRSILHGVFGVFGDSGWTRVAFYQAFERAAWTSCALLMINGVLYVVDKKK